jgi:predicted DNA-binding protein
MTCPSSRRAGVVQGSQHAATGPEPSSGVGPALHSDESAPYPRPLRSYLELGALPTAVPCARLHASGTGSARTKNMVLRLDPDLAERLAAVAEVEGRTVSDVAREAIVALVEARRKDERFRRLLEDNLARHQRLLDLLREDQP